MSQVITVGSFPYAPGYNPYQSLFASSLERAGARVYRIAPRKIFPVGYALNQPVDVLHFDWHQDWYNGRNWLSLRFKEVAYRHALRNPPRIPIVWTAHNLVTHDSKKRSYDHEMTQLLISRLSGIVVMSEASACMLKDTYCVSKETRMLKLYHGHYADFYPNTVNRSDARDALGIKREEFVYLCLGALRRYKGHLQLIRAFAEGASPGSRLVIAGPCFTSDYLDELKLLVVQICARCPDIKIDIHAAAVPEQELQLFFNAADVCVLPFVDVLNSGSLLLAMSFGIPVVAPRIGSIPEVAIAEYFEGYDPNAENGLGVAMQNALRRFTKNSLDSRSYIDRVKKLYSWDENAQKLLDLYRELIE